MSSQFTVSVQLLILIAINKDQKVTSEMISESTGGNPVMIRQLFGKLKSAGILNVSTGRGATSLARAAADISLWDIYMAIEGYQAKDLFKFHPKISNGCQIGRFFQEILEEHLDEAILAMAEKMSGVSLKQLIDEWQVANNESEK